MPKATFKNYEKQVANFKEGGHIIVAQVDDDSEETIGFYLRTLLLRMKAAALDGVQVDYETAIKMARVQGMTDKRKLLTSVREVEK